MPLSVIGTATVGADEFKTSARPDPFDARDFPYRSRLTPLPPVVDQRTLNDRLVMKQDGNSCTGHAVAAMINTALAKQKKKTYEHVSPFMLYHFARRYDEFEGEEDSGSSLRGALKGWWRHGVALRDDWPALDTLRDLYDEDFSRSCAQRPLGAFYRVDPQSLDDMQSAITELHAIVASAAVHDGWISPQREGQNFVIRRSDHPETIGGHAFALVGYNDVGFLVQNSWGTDWGKGGYATLPYDDWLEYSWDAWVARPGVPQTPLGTFVVQRTVDESGRIVAGKPLDMARLRKHVVNLGDDGLLSRSGQFTSDAAQLHGIIDEMKKRHAEWNSRDVVLYAHGGLVSERSGLETAQGQLQWWLDNHVFPIFFAWESGPADVIKDQLSDIFKKKAGGIIGKVEDALDAMVEKIVRNTLFWAWDQMKQNARGASKDSGANTPPDADFVKFGGASLLAHLLADHAAANGPIRLHLVGHSAGAVVLNPMLDELNRRALPVNTFILMASAGNVKDFETQALPHLSPATRFTTFGLKDKQEQDDTVLSKFIYRKSLLYLVSRAFERPSTNEEPLIGMQRFSSAKLRDNTTTVDAAIAAVGGERVWSPTDGNAPPNARSAAQHHTDFDTDILTMTSVARRILGRDSVIEFELDRKPSPAAIALGVQSATPAKSPVVGRRSQGRP